jgi:hypothetical protein
MAVKKAQSSKGELPVMPASPGIQGPVDFSCLMGTLKAGVVSQKFVA